MKNGFEWEVLLWIRVVPWLVMRGGTEAGMSVVSITEGRVCGDGDLSLAEGRDAWIGVLELAEAI